MNEHVILLALFNAASMLLFLCFIDGVVHNSLEAGASVVMFLFLGAAVLLCLVLNFVWLCASMWWAIDERRFKSIILWLIVAAAWIVSVHVAASWMKMPACVPDTQCAPGARSPDEQHLARTAVSIRA